MVAEMVHCFLLPEVEKKALRQKGEELLVHSQPTCIYMYMYYYTWNSNTLATNVL